MKRSIYLSFVLLLLMVGTCKKNPVESLNLDVDHAGLGLAPIIATDTTYNTVFVQSEAQKQGGADITERGFCWSETQNPTLENDSVKVGSGLGVFKTTLTELWANTDYYIKPYVKNAKGIYYGEAIQIKTKPPVIASVQTGSATAITAFSAQIQLTVADNGGRPILEKGIAIGTSPNPTVSSSIAEKEQIKMSSETPQKVEITWPITTNFSTYETNEVKKTENKEQTTSETDLEANSLSSKPKLEPLSNTSSSSKTDLKPRLTDQTTELVTLSNLVPNTTYYIRAYVITEVGTSYGANQSFQTPGILQTAPLAEIRAQSAQSGGTITTVFGDNITARGIVFNTSPNPTLAHFKTLDGSGFGTFTSALLGLAANTTYYVRSYASSSGGTSYGDERQFTTRNGIITLSTSTPSQITSAAASTGGEITDDGGATITERGVVYAETQNPTVSQTKVTSSGTIGSFVVSLSNLTPNTTYYVRSFAVNSIGTVYGEEKSFTSLGITLPIPELTTLVGMSSRGFELDAIITASHSLAITEKGFVWSLNENPTIDDNKVELGSGSSSFNTVLTNLNSSTTYYVRSFAINIVGIGYGNEVKFKSADFPSLTTIEISDIGATNATSWGNITDESGTTVRERGIVWSTSPNPTTTINQGKTVSGTGTGLFSASLMSLTNETIYYVRAYAINEVGIGYGNEVQFTTRNGVIILSTTEPTGIGVTYATSGGNITDDGGATVTERGIIWGLKPNPSIYENQGKTKSGIGIGSFSASLTNLTGKTTYFVRVYAINEIDIYYGNDYSFTTIEKADYTNSIGMEFMHIEPGSFYMGATFRFDTKPVHQVTLTQGYYMGKYEVTQKQWVEIMGSNPSSTIKGIGDNYPVNSINWNDVQTFITKLNEKEGGTKYRLPTEAEWEYCAHAGTATDGEGPSWHFGNDEAQFSNYAWYRSNSGSQTHEVGQKLPNQFGLHDMHGNVWEWVQDWYGTTTYSSGLQTDPKGPSSGEFRVWRGGSWYDFSAITRSAYRGYQNPISRDYYNGFRLLRTYP